MSRRTTSYALAAAVTLAAAGGLSTPFASAATKLFYAGSDGSGNAVARVFVPDELFDAPIDIIDGGTQYGGMAVAVDSSTGRLYWAGQTDGGTGLSANNRGFLRGASASDGSSVGMTAWSTSGTGSVFDLTIDPLTQKAFWSGSDGSPFLQSGTIGGSSLTLGAAAGSPSSDLTLALNPANGRLITGQSIATNGSTVSLGQYLTSTMTPSSNYLSISTTQRGITSIVTDLTGSVGYWTVCNTKGNAIGTGCIDSSGVSASGDVFKSNTRSTTGVVEAGITALAVDGNGCLIYANRAGDIKRSSTVASCTQATLLGGTGGIQIASLWIVESPSATGAPTVSGTDTTGGTLTCTDATWAADVPGARLSRMPASRTYAWQRNGATVPGAAASTHAPDTAGAYTCTVTGTNVAGTGTSAASAARTVVATSSGSSSGASTPSVPSAPTSVTAARSGTGAIAVKWTAPASNGGSAVTGYTVTASPGGRTCTTSTTTCTVSSLTNGTNYTFTVVARNAVGTGSASSASAAAYPYASLKVTWKMSGRKATASWKPVSGAKSYTLTGGRTGKTQKRGACTKTRTKVTCTMTLPKGTNTLTASARNSSKRTIAKGTTSKRVK